MDVTEDQAPLESQPAGTEVASRTEDDNEQDNTLHAFNITSNTTVIEKNTEDVELRQHETIVEINTKVVEITIDVDAADKSKSNSCEGSDSGVEVLEIVETHSLQRTHSANSENVQDFKTITPAQSYDSSIISYGSNYDEAYNILARRNSTLLEDYKLGHGDGTSEGGSESSSVASMRGAMCILATVAKKKIPTSDRNKKEAFTNKTRIKPPLNQLKSTPNRTKPPEKSLLKTPKLTPKPTNPRPKPDTLNLKKDVRRSLLKQTPNKGTPLATPTDDGRWPSVHSKPSPAITRSMRAVLTDQKFKVDPKNTTLEKYATLPRRRREKSADNVKDIQKTSRDNSMTRSSLVRRQSSRETAAPTKSLPPYPRRKVTPKTKIYHETSCQTALTISDIEKALSGVPVSPTDPRQAEMFEISVQVDDGSEELKLVKDSLDDVTLKYEQLKKELEEQKVKLVDAELRLKEECLEKDGLKEELKRNTDRVLAILGGEGTLENDENPSSDSLLMLESRFQNVSQVIINQENEISKLNAFCRALQRDLDKSDDNQRSLLQQQRELHEEGLELKNFMQEEKNALSDALKEAEDEVRRSRAMLGNMEEKCKQLTKQEEQSRHEMYSLQARLSAIETKGRELLVHQGSNVSGAAVALTGLISRLDGLLYELVSSYSISQQELDDVVFHNEVYSNSSSGPEAGPGVHRTILKDRTPSPKGGSSFISAVINAIKNATSQAPFSGQRDNSKDTIYTDNSNSSELLDSETEPCLMMEPVLEDVVVPDSHTHNMISSTHGMFGCSGLTGSESLTNFSRSLLSRQISDQNTISQVESLSCSFTSDVSTADRCSSVSLVDQVIEVDNLITRLLKVIRIVQLDNEQAMNELQEERDAFFQQLNKHKDTNKVVVKQLQDWELLGSRLKTEVKELMQQLTKKNKEIEDTRCDLNNQRKEVERLNQDVCELSTALSKAEHEAKLKEEESIEALKTWEAQGDMPPNEILGRILVAQQEVGTLRKEITEKDQKLNDLVQEYAATKQLFSDHLKAILNESKKQYEAIDNVLGVLHNIQPVINEYPELIKVQQDLEKVCMLTASPIPLVTPPPDYNANAAIVQAMANLGIMPTIDTTA